MRRVWHEEEWWYVLEDVVAILTESNDTKQYIRRMQLIAIRTQLTDEWRDRGVKEGQEFAILTAEISKANFGLTPSEYKDHKGLKKENLRDHMH